MDAVFGRRWSNKQINGRRKDMHCKFGRKKLYSAVSKYVHHGTIWSMVVNDLIFEKRATSIFDDFMFSRLHIKLLVCATGKPLLHFVPCSTFDSFQLHCKLRLSDTL